MKMIFFSYICDPLINILCIKNYYYYSTRVYKYDDANEQNELLKKQFIAIEWPIKR